MGGDLELTLTWLGMNRYLERFLEAGFESWETVLEITENDLDILNVDLGHRRKLQREIANTKRLARGPAFVTPLYGIDSPGSNIQMGISSTSRDVQPAGASTKRGYRHHPKPDPKAPERPYAAYVLFSNFTRDQLKEQKLSFTDFSKVVGERWQQLPREEKEEWKKKGAVPWERYKAQVAEYQKTEDFREYQRYLAEFKAAHASKNTQGKSSATMQSPVSSSHQVAGDSFKHLQTPINPTTLSDSEEKHYRVAIKRLKRDEETWNQGPDSGTTSLRVRQACELCRSRKIKCYGEQPTCRHCRELGLDCYYASGKRAQKRQDDEIRQKLKVYEELLLKFVPQVDDDDQRLIHDAILMPPNDEAARSAYKDTVQSGSQSGSRGAAYDSDTSGAGSMGVTDCVNKDDLVQHRFTNNAPAFAGNSSETKWTEKLNQELLPKQEARTSKTQDRYKDFSQKPQSYGEDTDSAVVGHQIDPFSLPIKSTADSLVNAYFSTIHTSFPILNKIPFMNQYDQLYSTKDPEGLEQRTFLAKLQLVFAIAAVHAHLIQADWAGDARDHMLYSSQARVLATGLGILNDACYLSQVQVFGLGGMYLLVTNQLNRAWNISGLAIRSAQALGLHLRDVSGSVSAGTKEFHAYNWFALMTLESMLTLMTGRPSMINPRDCSVTIPRTFAEGKSSGTAASPHESSYQRPAISIKRHSSSPDISESRQEPFLDRGMKDGTTRTAAIYFVHYAELCMLAKEVMGDLYYPGIRKKKQPDIRRIIDRFDRRLFEWKDGVNAPLDTASPSVDTETESCRVALRLLFHSTRIIINRPCLCKIKERMQEQSSTFKRQSLSSANKCVQSARATLTLIIYKPEATIIREGTTWWMLLHHLKRSLTVLLLELAFRAEHMPSEADEILAEAKAAVNWLHHMGKSSLDARHTCSHMRKLLRLAAQKVGGDTSDIMTTEEEEEEEEEDQEEEGEEAAAPLRSGQEQRPLADYVNAGPGAYPIGGPYGEPDSQEQWQYYLDLTARNELDDFGFLRAEGGMGSLFPTAADETDGMTERQGGGHDEMDYEV